MTPLIDHAYLSEQTFGDVDLARELLGLFAGQCRRLMPGIADADLDPDRRADLAHTLKGSALGIGAAPVGDLAASIEDRLREGRGGSAGDGRTPRRGGDGHPGGNRRTWLILPRLEGTGRHLRRKRRNVGR